MKNTKGETSQVENDETEVCGDTSKNPPSVCSYEKNVCVVHRNACDVCVMVCFITCDSGVCVKMMCGVYTMKKVEKCMEKCRVKSGKKRIHNLEWEL